jgi:single-stranded-DNA-specific exonuclease
MAGARDVGYYIPHRVEEGYGVNGEALRKLVVEEKANLVITVDCGISAVKEAALARELGVELIITDHHTIGAELPQADAIVHPRLERADAPCGDHCGAAVAFKLAWQICKQFGDGKKASPQLREYLMRSMGLVALATVADMVPLSDENRIIVRHGLGTIATKPSVGLRALMEVTGCLGKKRLSTATVGFGLAPRINAAGRLERARRAVEMLTTQDADLALEIARELDSYNVKRQEVERRIVEEARAMVEAQGGVENKRAIVLGHRDWHAGVIGIVAGRLVETYHRPTIILAIGEDVVQGSARSIPGFDLYSALKDCSEGLIAFGGHSAAAGLKLTEAHLPVFAERFEARCGQILGAEPLDKVMVVDAEVPIGVLSLSLVEQLDRLEPYGMGNPRPLFLASDLEIVGDPKPMGEHRNHLQIRFKQGETIIRAVGWNLAERGRVLHAGDRCSVLFQPTINDWQDRKSVQLEIKDFSVDDQVLVPSLASSRSAAEF